MTAYLETLKESTKKIIRNNKTIIAVEYKIGIENHYIHIYNQLRNKNSLTHIHRSICSFLNEINATWNITTACIFVQ